MKKSLLIASVAIIFSIGGVFLVNAQTGTPAAQYDMNGWAWSSNIGWLNFNCGDQGVCASSNYKVTVDSSNGNMSGYAWSSNIGWVKFGGLSNFPGSGINANVNLSTGAVTGWIRACAGTASGSCSTMNSRTDGWDGWIELSGTNHTSPDTSGNSGVTMITSGSQAGVFKGFAWGGPVVGWLNFSPGIGLPVTCQNSCGGGGGGPTLTGTCTLNGSPNGSVTLPPAGGSVTLNVTDLNGTGPYTYSWQTGVGSSNSAPPISPTYTVSGQYAPNVRVTDTSNGSMTGILSCGTVTVPSASAPINLFIGNSVASASRTSLQITQGNPFALKWETNLDDTYTCSQEFAPKDANPADNTFNNDPLWDTWKTGTSVSNVSNDGLSMSSTGVRPNDSAYKEYQFTLTCTDGEDPPDIRDRTVNLIIKSSTVIEI